MLNISAVKIHNTVRKKISARFIKNDKERVWEAQVELNLSLDSFAIHARNLIEFFYFDIKQGKDYVRSEHYLDDERNKKFKSWIKEFDFDWKNILDKANNQVAHLSFNRNEPRFQGDGKAWHIKIVYQFNEIVKTFLEMADEKKPMRYPD